MIQKIKKLPLLLILAILLAIGSSGFAFYQYRELQHFKDAGLFYDSNQKQVVLSPVLLWPFDDSYGRQLTVEEIKNVTSGHTFCSIRGAISTESCLDNSLQLIKNIDYDKRMFLNSQLDVNRPVSAKYYGWFGSDKVELNINTPAQTTKYNGDYFNNSEKKTYNLVGKVITNKQSSNGLYNINESFLIKNTISLEETTDGLLTGQVDLFSQDNTNKLAGLSNDTLDKLNAENLYGMYTSKDEKQYDVFLTKNKEIVDNWVIEEIKGKLYLGNGYSSYGTQNSIAFVKGASENYFSNENWNFKNMVDGQEVIIRGKTRKFTSPSNNSGPIATYQPPYLPCNDGPGCQGKIKPGYTDPFTTDTGIFNIESVEKI
jgi:hypothetical protein